MQGFHQHGSRLRGIRDRSASHSSSSSSSSFRPQRNDFRARLAGYRQESSPGVDRMFGVPALAPRRRTGYGGGGFGGGGGGGGAAGSTLILDQDELSGASTTQSSQQQQQSSVTKKLKKMAAMQALREEQRRESTIGAPRVMLTDQPIHAKTLASMCTNGGITPEMVVRTAQALGETAIRDVQTPMEVEIAALVLLDLGYEAVVVRDDAEDARLDARRRPVPSDLSAWQPRAPVVCVMYASLGLL